MQVGMAARTASPAVAMQLQFSHTQAKLLGVKCVALPFRWLHIMAFAC